MKKLFLLFLPIISFGQGQSQQFIVEGNLPLQTKSQKVYLEYNSYSGQEMVVHTDSASLTDRKFSFTGKVSEPSIAKIYYYPYGPFGMKSSLDFFLAPGKTSIKNVMSLELSTVAGTNEAEEYLELKQMGKKFKQKLLDLADSLITYEENNDKEGLSRFETKSKTLLNEIADSVFLPFFLDHLNSSVGVYALEQIINLGQMTTIKINDPEKTKQLFSLLSPTAKKLQSAMELEKRVEGAMRTRLGAEAHDFAMPDSKGKSILLSSFKGKYVLVDFWASWCRPCREEAPNLVAAFSKYRDKGFTILGVALEQEGGREKWLKAITKDNLSWTQVSDFKHWKSEAAKLFSVTSIPFNFLVDPQGKIIARNIRGAELNDTLSKLFK